MFKAGGVGCFFTIFENTNFSFIPPALKGNFACFIAIQKEQYQNNLTLFRKYMTLFRKEIDIVLNIGEKICFAFNSILRTC